MNGKPIPAFGHAEIVEAVSHAFAEHRYSGGPGEGMSMMELRKVTGRGENQIRKALASLRDQGRLGSSRVWREAIDGVMRPIPVYFMQRHDVGE